MTQADRDRLVTLKKAKKKLITQREAAEELELSMRQVKRLLYGLKKRGDKAVVHGLRGKAVEPADRGEHRKAGGEDLVGAGVRRVRADLGGGVPGEEARDRGEQRDGAAVDDPRQAVAGEEREGQAGACWRPRRSRFGELVQWDTSEHDWLEGRGEKLYLIAMIDDATSRIVRAVCAARFDRGEHEAAVELPGEVRPAGGVLHRQGEHVSDGGEAQTG
jgi:hypothetical protein